MSNIRTLKDLERQENTSALPNVWSSGGTNSGSSGYGQVYSYDERNAPGAGYAGRPAMQYMNMNGEMVTSDASAGPGKMLCLSCFPCFVEPCGEERREEYKRCLFSFTLPLSVVQVIMLIVALAIGGVIAYADNPAIGPGSATFVTLGAKWGPKIRDGQVWRLITPVFLHAGIFHLFFNLWAQLRFGLYLERKWGTPRFIVVYVVSGIGATLFSCLVRPDTVSVGASGAIMGLFGGFLADIIMSWPKLESRYRITMLVQTAMWLTITMLLSVSQYVDAAAQFVLLLSCSPELLEATLRITLRSFGGAMTGFMLCIALFANQRDSPRVRRLVMVGGIASTIIYLVVGLALFYTVVKFAQ